MKEQTTESWVNPRLHIGTLCYRVVMWKEGAVNEESLKAREGQRTRILQRMREAGVKGTRGVLTEAQRQLRELNDAIRREAFAHTEVAASADSLGTRSLVAKLRGDTGVLGYKLGETAVEVYLELTDGVGVDEHVRAWQGANEERWTRDYIAEQLPVEETRQWLQTAREAGAENTDSEDSEEAPRYHHIPVLLNEAVEALQPAEGKIIVDATLGGGGHSEKILESGAEVIGIDRDPAARAAVRKKLAKYGEKIRVLAGNFRDIKRLVQNQGIQAVDGILADLGISSYQVDTPERGFSFLAEGPLDMRMDPGQPRCAADIVNEADERELADIFRKYGEERAARAIARRIVQQREHSRITTTTQLAEIICSVLPRKGKQHPATRTFQALRMAVNDESGALEQMMSDGLTLLRRGGRMVIITFHSIDDRAVKRFFERVTKTEIDRPEWAQPRANPEFCAKSITKKPLTPGQNELAGNTRARSAKMRIIERI